MKHLQQSLVGRPYWRGYEAPSTAFIATELAQIGLGHSEEAHPLQEVHHLPDLFDLLVKLNPIPTENEASINLGSIMRHIFQGKLADYRFAALSLQPQSLIRQDGFIRRLEVNNLALPDFKFTNLTGHIELITATQVLELGGFWQPGCELELIRQYAVNFYEADNQIRYHLHPGQAFVDFVRDRKLLLILPLTEESQSSYESVDIQRHGTAGAWVTFQHRK